MITGRKILARAAADRASREAIDVLSEGESLLTTRTPRQSTFRWMHSPEVDLLDYDCDMSAPELRKLAKARFDARMARKYARRRRYMRRHGQVQQSWPCKGIYGNRPSAMILDDPHAEMPTDEQRATLERWYERDAGHAPH